DRVALLQPRGDEEIACGRQPDVKAIAVLVLLVLVRIADAACNLIPSAAQTYRGTVGSTDRPYASPGDIVELRVRPALCDGLSSGFVTTIPPPSPPPYDVTIVFTPPQAGPRNVIVLSTDISGIGTCPGAASTHPITAG